MKCIVGKKMQMTQRFDEKGRVVPVTLVEAGPCTVIQVKDKERDGYRAIQLGFGQAKAKKITRPLAGHMRGLDNFAVRREFRVPEGAAWERGAIIDVDVFAPGDVVRVTGRSKGRGFQGVVKRHSFHGSPASHGHKDQLRMPGSIGSKRQGPVQKGKRMPGRMGGERVTIGNLVIVGVDKNKHQLAIRGAIPGAPGSLVLIQAVSNR